MGLLKPTALSGLIQYLNCVGTAGLLMFLGKVAVGNVITECPAYKSICISYISFEHPRWDICLALTSLTFP